jgi:hypothetical protein
MGSLSEALDTISFQYPPVHVVIDPRYLFYHLRDNPQCGSEGSKRGASLSLQKKQVESSRPVREGVSKGEEDSRRPPTLQAGHPQTAVWGVAHPQGV